MGNSVREGSQEIHKELLLAKVRINDALTVEALLAEGMAPSCWDEGGNTLLHIAASEGHVSVLDILLRHNVDLHARNFVGVTSVVCAASSGHATALRMILEKSKYDIGLLNDQDSHGATALAIAATEGHLAVVELLLRCDGVLLDMADELGHTALHRALLFEQLEVFWMLFQAGANTLNHDHRLTTPLMSAAIRGYSDVVHALLSESTSNVNAVNLEDFTALHMAVRMGSVVITKALINAGAAMDLYDKMQLTPVLWAAQYGKLELTQVLLLEGGCDPTWTDIRGRNLLHHAAFFGWADIAEWLLAKGMDSNVPSISGNTPLILALRNSHFDTIKLMLDHNCDLKVPSCFEQHSSSLLVLTLERGSLDLCKLLYKAGCSLTERDVQQVDPLHPMHPTGILPQDWIDSVVGTPRCLQDGCRIAIRRSLGHYLRCQVTKLPIPHSLQNFLLIDEIQCHKGRK